MEERYTIPFDGNRYCGPAALAYIMRGSPTDSAKVIRDVTGKRAVTGTPRAAMLVGIERCGREYKTDLGHASHIDLGHYFASRGTQGEWLLDVNTARGKHYIIVHDGLYFDSMCHFGKPFSQCPYLRRRVNAAWRIL